MKNSSVALIIITTLLLITTTSVQAQAVPSANDGTQQEEFLTIEGAILIQGTAAVNYEVIIRNAIEGRWTTNTDEKGDFIFEKLPMDIYYIVIEKYGRQKIIELNPNAYTVFNLGPDSQIVYGQSTYMIYLPIVIAE